MSNPSNHSERQPSLADFSRDFLASIVVFLVALPLCMGIAIASGVPVAAGLITGIVGGLVVASLAGAPLQVSGPAAGLTVIVFDLVREHGIAALGVAVLLCGLIQFAAGLCKLGQWFRAVSPTVIHAMLSGIGILIVASQIHVMVDDKPRESGLSNLLTIPEALVKGLPWPQWTSIEDHRARTDLLKRVGKLHVEQQDLEAEIEAHVSQHGSAELHQRQLEPLRALALEQNELAERFRALHQEVSAGEVLVHEPRRRQALLAAFDAAGGSIDTALRALEMHQGEEVRRTQAEAAAGLKQILPPLKNHDWAAKIGLITILVVVLWTAIPLRRLKVVPASLVAVVLATALSTALALPVLYVEIPERIADGITVPSLAVFNDVSLLELIKIGAMLAVIASAETLLCATAVDKMHHGPRTKYDQELMAQGIGNTVCGLLGALPMTGVIVRSAANVQAGAKSQWSAFLHGVWLLVFVVVLAGVLRMIPIACLAGILVYTGYRLVDWRSLVRLWKEDRFEALIFLATVGLIVGEDLLTGVATGIVLSAIKLLVTFSHLEVQLVPNGGRSNHQRVTLRVAGAATFLRLPILAARLEEVPQGAELHVDFERLNYIDHSCLELLVAWARQHESSGGTLVIDWGQLHARFKEQRSNPRKSSASAATVEGAV